MEKLKTLSRITLFLAVLIAGGLVSSGDLAAQFAGGSSGIRDVSHTARFDNDGKRTTVTFEVTVTLKDGTVIRHIVTGTYPNERDGRPVKYVGAPVTHGYSQVTNNEGETITVVVCALSIYAVDFDKGTIRYQGELETPSPETYYK